MKFIILAIKAIALLMFLLGVVACFYTEAQSYNLSFGYMGKHSPEVLYWKLLFVQSVVTTISSVFVYGFSYIVEAACKYLRKDENVEVEE